MSAFEKPRNAQHVEAVVIELRIADFQHVAAEVLAERPLVEHELDVEGRCQPGFDLGNLLVTKALGPQCSMIEGRSIRQRAMAHGIGDDLLDLRLRHSPGCEALPAPPG